MSAVTCGTATAAPIAASAVAKAHTPSTPSLLRRLAPLQPHFCLRSGRRTTGPAVSPPPSMSYSFVVVPPPVPAATQSFEKHISTLLRHVPSPAFVTCTSYSPYFTSEACERAHCPSGCTSPETKLDGAAASVAADNDGDGKDAELKLSATQQALDYLHDTLPPSTGLVLTITGTRTTTAAANADAASTLTGASPEGIQAVIRDFSYRLSGESKSKEEKTKATRDDRHSPLAASRCGGLMVLRGDDGGYTRRRTMAATTNEEQREECTSGGALKASANPYTHFADGAALMAFVRQHLNTEDSGSTRDSLTLFTGGYAQGHVLDRQWTSVAAPTSPSLPTLSESDSHRDTATVQASLAFLQHLDDVLASTEAQLRRAQGSHGAPHRPPSAAMCRETAAAIQARLHAARQLWQTPSRYDGEVRAACTRRLIKEKVLLRGLSTSSSSSSRSEGGARVIVTQMLASAAEFREFEADVQNALRELTPPPPAAAEAQSQQCSAPQESDDVVMPQLLLLVPGLMAPLRAEQFVRSALQLKAIPSLPLQVALQDYEAALDAALRELAQHSASPRTNTSTTTTADATTDNTDGQEDEDGERAGVAVTMFQQRKEAAELAFLSAMEEFTVSLARELYELGYTHINFSAFQYGCGDAIGRVVAQLP